MPFTLVEPTARECTLAALLWRGGRDPVWWEIGRIDYRDARGAGHVAMTEHLNRGFLGICIETGDPADSWLVLGHGATARPPATPGIQRGLRALRHAYGRDFVERVREYHRRAPYCSWDGGPPAFDPAHPERAPCPACAGRPGGGCADAAAAPPA